MFLLPGLGLFYYGVANGLERGAPGARSRPSDEFSVVAIFSEAVDFRGDVPPGGPSGSLNAA